MRTGGHPRDAGRPQFVTNITGGEVRVQLDVDIEVGGVQKQIRVLLRNACYDNRDGRVRIVSFLEAEHVIKRAP